MIGGTKCPSMTSTWITRAPAAMHLLDLRAEAREVGRQDRRRDARERGHQIGTSIDARQWLHWYSAVLDMRTIVECSPQSGHTDESSKRCRQFTQR